MALTTTVLKTDALGRITLSKEHREALLDAFDESGLKGLEFARLHGVNYQTFANWVQKRRAGFQRTSGAIWPGGGG